MQSPSQHCVPLPVGYMSNSSSCTTPETQQIDGTPGCHPVSQVPIWPLQSLRSPWIFQEDLELPPWERLPRTWTGSETIKCPLRGQHCLTLCTSVSASHCSQELLLRCRESSGETMFWMHVQEPSVVAKVTWGGDVLRLSACSYRGEHQKWEDSAHTPPSICASRDPGRESLGTLLYLCFSNVQDKRICV